MPKTEAVAVAIVDHANPPIVPAWFNKIVNELLEISPRAIAVLELLSDPKNGALRAYTRVQASREMDIPDWRPPSDANDLADGLLDRGSLWIGGPDAITGGLLFFKYMADLRVPGLQRKPNAPSSHPSQRRLFPVTFTKDLHLRASPDNPLPLPKPLVQLLIFRLLEGAGIGMEERCRAVDQAWSVAQGELGASKRTHIKTLERACRRAAAKLLDAEPDLKRKDEVAAWLDPEALFHEYTEMGTSYMARNKMWTPEKPLLWRADKPL